MPSDSTLLTPRFKKKAENFTCHVCGTYVSGTGYTDHCPECLWSLHVDVNPGDRACTCRGLMEPTGCVKKGDTWVVSYRCTVCGYHHDVKTAEDDNFEAILALAQKPLPND